MGLGKRITNQIVIDKKTKKAASIYKCAIRNFTDIFWIVEIIAVLIQPNRRIGDLIAHTKIVRLKNSTQLNLLNEIKTINTNTFIISFLFSMAYSWLIFKGIQQLILFFQLLSINYF